MTIPADHNLSRPQLIQRKADLVVFQACNCGSQPANQTLRYVAANRELFNVWPLPSTATVTTTTPIEGTGATITEVKNVE